MRKDLGFFAGNRGAEMTEWQNFNPIVIGRPEQIQAWMSDEIYTEVRHCYAA